MDAEQNNSMTLKSDLSNFNEMMQRYQTKIADASNDLSIKGKTLTQANIEQASHLSYYDEMKANIKFICDYIEIKIKQVRAECWAELGKSSNFSHSDRAKDKLTDAHPEYIRLQKMFIRAEMMSNILNGIVDQYRSRAFLLNNLVKIKTAALDDITL